MSKTKSPFEAAPPDSRPHELSYLASVVFFSAPLHGVGPEHYADPSLASVHESVARLVSSGVHVDAGSVAADLRRVGIYDQVGGADLMVELSEVVPSGAAAKFHADRVLEAAGIRAELDRLARRCAAINAGAIPPDLAIRQTDKEVIPIDENSLPEVPTDVLPKWASDYLVSLCYCKEVDPSFGVPIMLATFAAACQRKYVVELNQGYTEPLAIFASPAMTAGERKTAVINPIAAPLVELQTELAEELKDEIENYIMDKKIHEKRVSRLESKLVEAEKSEQEALRRELKDLMKEAPVPVSCPQLVMGSFSEAALVEALKANRENMFVYSDEGGMFEELAGRHNGGKTEIEVILKAHAGSPYTSNRVARGVTHLKNPLMSIAISPQPSVLMSLGKKDGFLGKGLLARWIWVIPSTMLGYRSHQYPQIPENFKDEYKANVKAIASMCHNHEGPRLIIRMDEKAYTRLMEWQAELEPQFLGTGRLRNIPEWGNKLVCLVARIAAVCHIARHGVDRPEDRGIPIDTMEAAISLGEVLIEHANAVHLMFDGSSPETHAMSFVKRMNDIGWPVGELNESEWALKARKEVGDDRKVAFRHMVEILERHNYLIRGEKKTRGRTATTFRANDALIKKT